MFQKESLSLIELPSQHYLDLTTEAVQKLNADQAEQLAVSLVAEMATVTEGGKILRWSEFNENPDPIINTLLAHIICIRIGQDYPLNQLSWANSVVVSIESSASYLATALSEEIQRLSGLARPLRLIRARKLPHGEIPSPAQGDNRFDVKVYPITAGGEFRYLTSSLPIKHHFEDISMAFVVDDFKATGSTLGGGVELVKKMLSPATIIPIAALGKPEQELSSELISDGVWLSRTALDVHFWGDSNEGRAYIAVNGYPPLQMSQASAEDFH